MAIGFREIGSILADINHRLHVERVAGPGNHVEGRLKSFEFNPLKIGGVVGPAEPFTPTASQAKKRIRIVLGENGGWHRGALPGDGSESNGNARAGPEGRPGCWQDITRYLWPAPYLVMDTGASIAPYNHFELGQPMFIEYVWGRQIGENTINP